MNRESSYSPYGSTPGPDYYAPGYDRDRYEKFASPSPTPSPRPFFAQATPQRPATRAHFRNASGGGGGGYGSSSGYTTPRQPAFSPRYTSDGLYGTAPPDVRPGTTAPSGGPPRPAPNVSASRPSRKTSWSSPQLSTSSPRLDKRGRRSSFSHEPAADRDRFPPHLDSASRRHSYHPRASDHHGDTDDDEYFEYNGGRTFVWPDYAVRPKSARRAPRADASTASAPAGHCCPRQSSSGSHYYRDDSGQRADYNHLYAQGSSYYYEKDVREAAPAATPGYDAPRPQPQVFDAIPRRSSRRSSTSMPTPQRPATAAGTRPMAHPRHHKTASSQSSSSNPTPAPRKATAADAERFKIPAGFSLKNWDPAEEPILLLGSVFDANSLGKWIYDWTVYHHGPNNPIPEIAGELWLLLIQLSGKIKRAEDSVRRIRTKENKEMVEDFIESGERLTDKLRKLLKTCETPMLQASKTAKGASQLGNNAGVEFVRTLFGLERELERTEAFMQNIRVWIFRFDRNCEEILKKPTV